MGNDSKERAIRLTEKELHGLVTDAVRQTFISLGIDIEEPLEMQKDFQHLRDWRTTTEAVKRKSILTMAAIIVAGLCGLAWLAISGK